MKRLLLLLPLLVLAGCHAPAPAPQPTPVPIEVPTPQPTPLSLYAARRIAPGDVFPLRAFIGPIWFGSGVLTKDGQTFVPARKIAGQLDALTPKPNDFPVMWDFNLRTITVAGHTFHNAALVNRTGFVACEEAGKTFDLRVEQHGIQNGFEGNAVLFEPVATLGGSDNADYVYKDPNELLNTNNGKVPPGKEP